MTITAAYGHGVSASPLNLAAAYATIANGGIKVTPTLLKRTEPMQGDRVMTRRSRARIASRCCAGW